MKKRNFDKQTFQYYMHQFKQICKQLIVPFCIFQGIRTFLFPTTIDVLLLAIFIAVALGFHYEWI